MVFTITPVIVIAVGSVVLVSSAVVYRIFALRTTPEAKQKALLPCFAGLIIMLSGIGWQSAISISEYRESHPPVVVVSKLSEPWSQFRNEMRAYSSRSLRRLMLRNFVSEFDCANTLTLGGYEQIMLTIDPSSNADVREVADLLEPCLQFKKE